MAWAIVPSKGEYAPCNPPTCKHLDCAAATRIVRSECRHCHEPIGLDRKYCDGGFGPEHFVCALKNAESA